MKLFINISLCLCVAGLVYASYLKGVSETRYQMATIMYDCVVKNSEGWKAFDCVLDGFSRENLQE